jgi:hypothetical protein
VESDTVWLSGGGKCEKSVEKEQELCNLLVIRDF